MYRFYSDCINIDSWLTKSDTLHCLYPEGYLSSGRCDKAQAGCEDFSSQMDKPHDIFARLQCKRSYSVCISWFSKFRSYLRSVKISEGTILGLEQNEFSPGSELICYKWYTWKNRLMELETLLVLSRLLMPRHLQLLHGIGCSYDATLYMEAYDKDGIWLESR